MKKTFLILYYIFLFSIAAFSQKTRVNRQLFFSDERVIEATLSTDIKKLRTDKKEPAWQPAKITMQFPDSAAISEEIRVQPRGEFRKNNCDLDSLMLNFKNPSSPRLSALKKLKLVGGCQNRKFDEELLLKEYLVYKLYSQISLISFQVRLLHINYSDSKQQVKPYAQYAFLIEDIEDLAARNNCKEVEKPDFLSEGTNRQQMTLVALFQYMIGNTDWAVWKYHNIKLMVSKNDTLSPPYAVPYDFDYSGIVDAEYAIPNESLGIKSVRERLYRGYERTMEELQEAINIFIEKKSRMSFTINNFTLLSERERKNMTSYIEEFYKIITNNRSIKNTFIGNARKV